MADSSSFKRITPDQVVEAYRKTGLLPVQGRWFRSAGPDACACGLTALVHAFGEGWQRDHGAPTFEGIEQAVGLTPDYASGFMRGFDGMDPRHLACGEHKAGHADGVAAWRAIEEAKLFDQARIDELFARAELEDWEEMEDADG